MSDKRSLYAGNLYAQVQALFQDAVTPSTPPTEVAEVLLHGTRDMP